MSALVISGDSSGTITLDAPAVAGSNTQTLVAVTDTLAPVVRGTSQTAPFTDNTRAEFTGIPSWVKRVTVMFNGVSTNGTSLIQVQIGSGSFTASGYVGAVTSTTSTPVVGTSTTGFPVIGQGSAGSSITAQLVLTNISGNIWVAGVSGFAISTTPICGGGTVTLSGALDRVRVITVNGTDTFDTGSIVNILYE